MNLALSYLQNPWAPKCAYCKRLYCKCLLQNPLDVATTVNVAKTPRLPQVQYSNNEPCLTDDIEECREFRELIQDIHRSHGFALSRLISLGNLSALMGGTLSCTLRRSVTVATGNETTEMCLQQFQTNPAIWNSELSVRGLG
jgi:hypothetical protein